MKIIKGTSNRILEVDLSAGSFSIYDVTPLERRMFLGAKGLGLKLIFDRLGPGIDPLGPDNIIAIMPGVLTGTGGPCSGRFEAVTKSPLTGIMVTSSCGGPFGLALKTAGWDGLIIKGKASSPVYLDIAEHGAEFTDAQDLWGLEIPDVQNRLDSKAEKSLIIGPAGENLVRYANIASGHRFLGRGGAGAVMGSKNLKAVRARGMAFSIQPSDKKTFKKIKARSIKYIKNNYYTSGDYPEMGTSSNVKSCLESGLLPIHNFRDDYNDHAERITGQQMALKHSLKHHTCMPCSIRCGHKGTFNSQEMSAPEYETIGLLGSSLGIFDLDVIAGLNRVCGRLGLDTISTGSTLAWIMEAASRGLVKSSLKFGDVSGLVETMHDIAFMKGFGSEMGMGTRFLSEKYGGQDFAIHVKGLEMAAYDPRGSHGQALAYSVANRGACHLSAYLVAQEIYFKLLKPNSSFGKALWVKFFEDLTCCINSLTICQFTMYAFLMEPPLARYTPDVILSGLMQYFPKIAIPLIDFSIYTKLWSSVTGMQMSCSEFLKAGERIHMLERYMNSREGISRNDDTLPGRLLNEQRRPGSNILADNLDKMISQYYKVRGYDKDGIPKQKMLEKLDINPPKQ